MTPDALLWLYQLTYDCVKDNLDGTTPDDLTLNPQPGGNNASWIMGHIIDARDLVLKLLGDQPILTAEEATAFKPFIEGVDRTKLLPFERLWEAWEESQKRIAAGLEKQTVESLSEIVPAVFEGGKPDLLWKKILFFHFHESYHVGQLGLLRRLMGKKGAIG